MTTNRYASIRPRYIEAFGGMVVNSLESYSCGVWMDVVKPYCEVCDEIESSVETAAPEFGFLQEVEEVNLDLLRAKDYLIIQTENSVYRFTLLDPEHSYGLLSGGSLGRHIVRATLVGTIPAHPPKQATSLRAIKRFSRAIFSVPSEEAGERLVTSIITKLTQVTGGLTTKTMMKG
jgi:hypothetical protein